MSAKPTLPGTRSGKRKQASLEAQDDPAVVQGPRRTSRKAAVQGAKANASDPPAKKAKVSKAGKEAAKEAKTAAANDAREQDIKTMAAAEDEIQREQRRELQNAERPDLATFAAYEPPVEQTPPIPDEPEKVDSDIPFAGEAVNSESDRDYLPPGSEDESTTGSEGLFSDPEERIRYRAVKEKLKKKKKEKKVRGELRAKVNEARKLKPNVPYAVKDVGDEEVKDEEIATKKKGLEGFRKDYNKPPPIPKASSTSAPQSGAPTRESRASRHANTNPEVLQASGPASATGRTGPRIVLKRDDASDDEPEEGGFKDEPPAAVIAARSSKAARLIQKNGTATMGLKVKKISINEDTKASAVPKKNNYSNKDLPLTGVTNGVQRWQRKVMSTVLAWAGTVEDPFNVNSHPAFRAIVVRAWDEVFEGEADFEDVVLQVAGAAIRTWRSKIGKEALDALREHFKSEEFRKVDARVKFVRDQLEGCRYVYEDPVKKTGAYRSPLLLQVFSYHEGLLEGRTDAWYGPPVGSLAFAATALERALKLWKDGNEVASSERKNFVQKPWGERVSFHVEVIKKFQDSHWNKLNTAAAPYVKAAMDSGVGLGDEGDGEEEETGREVVINISDDEDDN